jgi:hypothetical protein
MTGWRPDRANYGSLKTLRETHSSSRVVLGQFLSGKKNLEEMEHSSLIRRCLVSSLIRKSWWPKVPSSTDPGREKVDNVWQGPGKALPERKRCLFRSDPGPCLHAALFSRAQLHRRNSVRCPGTSHKSGYSSRLTTRC